MSAETSYKDTLLVVDDNHQNIKLLCTLLNHENYNLAVALNGHDALEIMRTSGIDLVLLDIMMPEIDGFEVCRQIKNDPQLHETPVIFVSALNDAENITTAFHAGGDDYLLKPVKSAELFVKIRTQLELAKYRKNKNSDPKKKTQIISDQKLLELAENLKSSLLPNEQDLKKLFPNGLIIKPEHEEPDGTTFNFFNKGESSYIIMAQCGFDPGENSLVSLIDSQILKTIPLNGIPSSPSEMLKNIGEYLVYSFKKSNEQKPKTQLGILSCDKKKQILELASNSIPFLYYNHSSESYEVVSETRQEGSYKIHYQPKDRIFVFNRKSMLMVNQILKNIHLDKDSQQKSIQKIMDDENISTLLAIEL